MGVSHYFRFQKSRPGAHGPKQSLDGALDAVGILLAAKCICALELFAEDGGA